MEVSVLKWRLCRNFLCNQTQPLLCSKVTNMEKERVVAKKFEQKHNSIKQVFSSSFI